MNVFIVCSGLGHINRGYESFTRECFDALKDNSQFNLYLLKGAGKNIGNEITVSNLPRQKKATRLLAKIFTTDAYTLEQATFCISMIPHIISKKPKVIYYSDFILGTYLWHLRRFLKFKYKLLFSNGAPNGPPFKTEDHVQQLLPVYLDQAVKAGAPASMQTLLPYGFEIDLEDRYQTINKKAEIKQDLGFKTEQKIILSVGAVNRHHKRMDYLINEVSRLDKSYHLVILGQFEVETDELIRDASKKLSDRFTILNVDFEKVKQYYIVADYFVLASLNEGFGRVLVEALSYGLTCIVHDYTNARQVLGENALYINMAIENELTEAIINNAVIEDKKSLIKAAYNGYSWNVLKADYKNMIASLLN